MKFGMESIEQQRLVVDENAALSSLELRNKKAEEHARMWQLDSQMQHHATQMHLHGQLTQLPPEDLVAVAGYSGFYCKPIPQ